MFHYLIITVISMWSNVWNQLKFYTHATSHWLCNQASHWLCNQDLCSQKEANAFYNENINSNNQGILEW
jgi:hypothetical protein